MDYNVIHGVTDQGASLFSTRYRELVGTAETIVSMNTDIKEVESILADVGRRCNPQLVEKKHVHARQMKSDAAAHGMVFLIHMISGVGIQSLIH